MRSAAFYKFISGVLAILLALGGAYAAKIIHDAKLERDSFKLQKDAAQNQLDETRGKLEKYQEVFQRLQNDPEFLDHVARARLDYARPDELIFRFNVDPVTGSAATGNLDSTRSAANTPLLPLSRPAKPANTTTAQRR
jgi:cell division protein FtsB